jgi:hypothetical protein
MGETNLGMAEIAAVLAALANGILPADERDEGAAAVAAGPRLAEQVAAGVNAALYRSGVAAAAELARQRFGRGPAELDAGRMQELIGALRERQAAFFRQLRADVCALYLADPGVWARIGFPGPSTEQGGYPDFDQRQADGPRLR